MEEGTWTGVTLQYICPNCGNPGIQQFVVEYPGADDMKAVAIVWKQRTPCKSCSKPLPDNLGINVAVMSGSLDELRRGGYPTPPVN